MSAEPIRLGCCWPNDANVKMLDDDCKLVMVEKPCTNSEECKPGDPHCWSCNQRERKAHGPYPAVGDAEGNLTEPLSEREQKLAWTERHIELVERRLSAARYELETYGELKAALEAEAARLKEQA